MRLKVTVLVCILQIFALAIGILFRTMHWPHGGDTILLSALLMVVFCVLAGVEIASGRANVGLKIFWISFYAVLVIFNMYLCFTRQALLMLLAGNIISLIIYLAVLRRELVPKKKVTDGIKFDSI